MITEISSLARWAPPKRTRPRSWGWTGRRDFRELLGLFITTARGYPADAADSSQHRRSAVHHSGPPVWRMTADSEQYDADEPKEYDPIRPTWRTGSLRRVQRLFRRVDCHRRVRPLVRVDPDHHCRHLPELPFLRPVKDPRRACLIADLATSRLFRATPRQGPGGLAHHRKARPSSARSSFWSQAHGNLPTLRSKPQSTQENSQLGSFCVLIRPAGITASRVPERQLYAAGG